MIADMTLSMGSYDVAGRMLTKTHSVNGTTRYEWDGWDIVGEYGPSTAGSAVYDSAHCDTDHYGWTGITSYYVVNGVLIGVDFDGGGTCAVIGDAMGHVRALVDTSGSAVFSASYSAYGEAINVTDSTPGGAFAMRYVGQFGVRWDADIQMYYMRQRWYDGAATGLQRFASRDPHFIFNTDPVEYMKACGQSPELSLGDADEDSRREGRYTYSGNRPTTYLDPKGLSATIPRPHEPNMEGWCKCELAVYKKYRPKRDACNGNDDKLDKVFALWKNASDQCDKKFPGARDNWNYHPSLYNHIKACNELSRTWGT